MICYLKSLIDLSRSPANSAQTKKVEYCHECFYRLPDESLLCPTCGALTAAGREQLANAASRPSWQFDLRDALVAHAVIALGLSVYLTESGLVLALLLVVLPALIITKRTAINRRRLGMTWTSRESLGHFLATILWFEGGIFLRLALLAFALGVVVVVVQVLLWVQALLWSVFEYISLLWQMPREV